MTGNSAAQRLEDARRKLDNDRQRITHLKATRENAQQRLSELLDKARNHYLNGNDVPDDKVVEKLRERYREISEENERLVREFEERERDVSSRIDAIESSLSSVGQRSGGQANG